jgi:hypothetical protein
MIKDHSTFDSSGHERTLVHIEFLSPGDSSFAGLVRPHRLAQRHVWQELQSAQRPYWPLPILRLTAAAARERLVTRVPSRRKLDCNGPVLSRKAGLEPDGRVQRSRISPLPSSRVNDREAVQRKFRVKLRLKLRRAVFP